MGNVMKENSYREPKLEEQETTINVIYDENLFSIYTNKVGLQKELNKYLGDPTREDKRKNKIIGSMWDIPLTDKTRISRMIIKANIFEL